MIVRTLFPGLPVIGRRALPHPAMHPKRSGDLKNSVRRPITLRLTFFILLALTLMGVRPATAASDPDPPVGPLEVRNQFAPHLMFLTPVPKGPNPLPKGGFEVDLSLDYSSVFFAEHSEHWSVLVDM
jgi:hypothetical protein